MFRRLLISRVSSGALTVSRSTASPALVRCFSAHPALQKKASKPAKSKHVNKKAAAVDEEPLAEEDPSKVLKELEKQMSDSLEQFKKRLAETKQGAANPSVFDNLDVPVGHGETQPYVAVAQTAIKGRNLIITVFDPANVKHVVSAVLASGLNMNPQEVPNFPQQLKVPLPAPTAEHRKEIAKELKKDFEHFKQSPSKHSLSSARAVALKDLKSYVKNDTVKKAEKEVEKLHKKFLDELQKQLKAAEKSVLS
ncbi:Ribosome-recycling factor, mitochondrial [Cyberlindnera fabianii]|uniref:Ribosome-recycling factor, mitochondrial n=1 Tax=Cyberlindnera fabianii TaxID=36022 RepID=A0A1V2LDK0_CYBFA|nr:Ribosome-recycling factor, mitochondrial [Cyberlindnera fabianii]